MTTPASPVYCCVTSYRKRSAFKLIIINYVHETKTRIYARRDVYEQYDRVFTGEVYII